MSEAGSLEALIVFLSLAITDLWYCFDAHKGNADSCYWGLPSIQASDPAYPPLGYWRGYVWGPMIQLVGAGNTDKTLF